MQIGHGNFGEIQLFSSFFIAKFNALHINLVITHNCLFQSLIATMPMSDNGVHVFNWNSDAREAASYRLGWASLQKRDW